MTVLEITTHVGCPVNCYKYCAQEVFISTYKGPHTLTLEKFKHFIKDIPTDVPIIFSGLCEPFVNQKCPDMILWAHEKGHPVVVFSTLVGLTVENAERIKDVPFDRFTLHLPDPYGVANIPETDTYSKVLNIILRNVERLWFMNMGLYFMDDHSEDVARGEEWRKPIRGHVMCCHLATPDYIVLPNGNVYFCCQTKGQTDQVGNLNTDTYQELVSKHSSMAKKLSHDNSSVCHRCSIARPYWLYLIREQFGAKLIDFGKRYFI